MSSGSASAPGPAPRVISAPHSMHLQQQAVGRQRGGHTRGHQGKGEPAAAGGGQTESVDWLTGGEHGTG